MKIRTKITLSFTSLLFFILFISSLSLFTIYELKEDTIFSDDIERVIEIEEEIGVVLLKLSFKKDKELISSLKELNLEFAQLRKKIEGIIYNDYIFNLDFIYKDVLDDLLNSILATKKDLKEIKQKVLNNELKSEHSLEQISKSLNKIRKKSSKIKEEITTTFFDYLLYLQSILVFVIVIITLFLSTYMTSQLSSIIKKLRFGVQQIKKGNYDFEIDIKEDKEFSQIADTFNLMSKNIKDHNDSLENKIKQRTKELEDKNSALEVLSNKLSKYLSPQVFQSIFSGKQDVILHSKREYLSVFFSDIKSFTELTDELEPERLTAILNEYLDSMSKIAIKYGATIDKYIGDAIMIFFGNPVSLGKKEDALKCVKMALEMKEQMNKLRFKWLQDGISDSFCIRMGINSGYCTVGNFGSQNRLDYTIIGGEVNLASRLESKATPNEILISSSTYSLIKDEVICQKKEKISVKGIAYKIQTYEVLSLGSDTLVLEEKKGLNLLVDLNEIEKDEAIFILENSLEKIKSSKHLQKEDV